MKIKMLFNEKYFIIKDENTTLKKHVEAINNKRKEG
jgi:hypothetical protein